MKRICMMLMVVSLVGAAGVGLANGAQAGECGDKGQTPCPLQGWMEKNVQIPMEKTEWDKVAASLGKVAGYAPDPAWNKGDKGWETTAKAGIAAAKAKDLKALKKTCKSCHKSFRKNYKAKFRMRPPPK